MASSPVHDADVGALVGRLRAELEATQDAGEGGDRPSWERARIEAGRLAAVSGDRPFFKRTGALGRLRGAAAAPLKVVLRRLMRWYVEPIAAEQRAFNTALLRLVDDVTGWTAAEIDRARRSYADELTGHLEPLARRIDRAERSTAALEDRFLRLERRPAAAAASSAPSVAQPAAGASAAPFDYFAFEGCMREGREEIRRRQRPYVDDFRDAAPVLDVGCGRGEFLALLRDAGVEARGVDIDSDMVAFSLGEGLDVVQADGVEYLAGLEDGTLGGIFGAHVVEHLRPEALVRFLALAAAKLREGGTLVLETPNPVSLIALKHYFADLTHSQPLVPETLAFLVRQAGFRDVDVRYLNEPQEEERLRAVSLPPEPRLADAQRALDANVARLNDVIFGPQDYAVAARR